MIIRRKTTKLTITEKNGKFGLKNAKNEIVVENLYDCIEEIEEGIFKVWKGKKYSYLDEWGNTKIKFKRPKKLFR